MSQSITDTFFSKLYDRIDPDHLKYTVSGNWTGSGSIIFESNGTQGGDAGHGGYASLTFKKDVSQYILSLNDNLIDSDCDKIKIESQGDWEIRAMIINLIQLGRLLEKGCNINYDQIKEETLEEAKDLAVV